MRTYTFTVHLEEGTKHSQIDWKVKAKSPGEAYRKVKEEVRATFAPGVAWVAR